MACGIIHVKVGGVWKPIEATAGNVYVKVGGVWKVVSNAFVRTGGTWFNTFCEAVHGAITYNVPGVYNFVVPAGVTSIDITMSGGGGGGGGWGPVGPGPTAGSSAGVQTITSMAVTPGNNITVYVGSGGSGGRSATGDCGSNGANWFVLNGCCGGGTAGTGYNSGTPGVGISCFFSFTPTGGWGGGGGGSSAINYPAGPTFYVAGGGTGGNNGQNAFGVPVVLGGGPGGNSGSTDGSFVGSAGGAISCAAYDCGFGATGGNGFVSLIW